MHCTTNWVSLRRDAEVFISNLFGPEADRCGRSSSALSEFQTETARLGGPGLRECLRTKAESNAGAPVLTAAAAPPPSDEGLAVDR